MRQFRVRSPAAAGVERSPTHPHTHAPVIVQASATGKFPIERQADKCAHIKIRIASASVPHTHTHSHKSANKSTLYCIRVPANFENNYIVCMDMHMDMLLMCQTMPSVSWQSDSVLVLGVIKHTPQFHSS